MKVTVNLATRPFTDLGPILKRLRIGMGVLVVVACGLLLGLHFFHQKAEAARAKEAAVDGEITRLRTERTGYQNLMKRPENAAVLDQAGTLNALFEEKSFSWTLAMEDLETVLPAGVQVATLEPAREKDGHITVKLRVQGARASAIKLVENLEHSKRFLAPRIVGESAEANESQGRGYQPVSTGDRVNFDLLADYNPPDPGERKATKAKAEPEAGAEAATPESAPTAPAARRPYVRTPHAGGAR